jgi:D-alanyl-D-alanine carboxypeptidase
MIEPREARVLEGLTASFLEQRGVPGVAAGVVAGDDLVWSTGLGLTRLEGGTRPDARTIFAIASVTKTFTATAVVQLRDDGLLELDDPLVRHIPEFAAARNPFGAIELVTLRHLLQHSSGLQGELPNRDPREWTLLSTSDVVATLDRVVVAIPPGTGYKYSNLGYRLLGEVVQRVSGRDFWDYLRHAIFEPLGMHDTTHAPKGALEERAAEGHRPGPAREPRIPLEVEGGEGGLWSTVEDLARWTAQQLRTDEALERGPGQVLRGASLLELQQPTFVAEEWTLARSLGWFRWWDGEPTLVVHDGHVGGFASSVLFSPADGVGAIVLANGATPAPGELGRKLVGAVRPLLPDEQRKRGAPDHVPSPEWLELLGAYRAADDWIEARVEVRDGRPVCVLPDGPVALRPTDDALCFVALAGRPVGETVRFFRGEDGTIAGLNLAGFPLLRDGAAAAE